MTATTMNNHLSLTGSEDAFHASLNEQNDYLQSKSADDIAAFSHQLDAYLLSPNKPRPFDHIIDRPRSYDRINDHFNNHIVHQPEQQIVELGQVIDHPVQHRRACR